ncbi:hypothetical protein GCM10027168_44870 [Streptomyces capparidis]
MLLRSPYRRRRAALEELFASCGLTAPWALSPADADPARAREWIEQWAAVGVEGVLWPRAPARTYQPGRRGWLKIRSRHTAETLIGAVTGHRAHADTLLLGRYDTDGLLRLIARTTPLTDTAADDVARVLVPAGPSHPWRGMRITARWGSREPLAFTCVEPAAVVEFSGDTAVDAGRWRHPVRALRLRPDLASADVPTAGAGYTPLGEHTRPRR